jgi:hypothetical protein
MKRIPNNTWNLIPCLQYYGYDVIINTKWYINDQEVAQKEYFEVIASLINPITGDIKNLTQIIIDYLKHPQYTRKQNNKK